MTFTGTVAGAAVGAIEPGARDAVSVFGWTLHPATVVSTVVAGAVVIAFGLLARRHLSVGDPGRLQLLWETVISAVENRVERSIGAAARRVVPLAVTLFFFIVFASWLDVIPSGHPQKSLPSPTGDLNFTVALAIVVIVAVHASAIRARGWRGYLRHYLSPSPWVLPINLIEELAKPFTLALRLFGNVFAGTVMVLIILELIPPAIAPLPLAAWVLFSMAVAVLQGFLFSLLTVLYFQAALVPDDVGTQRPLRRLAPASRPVLAEGGTLDADR